jgi:hypothetical protein
MATGSTVQKTNFIEVMSNAFVRAFTKRNIQTAFRKTGVVPLNPQAISPEDMAPSIEQSCRAIMPLRPPSPLRTIVDFLQASGSDDPPTPAHVQEALASTSVAYLFSDSPVTAENANLPLLSYTPLDPIDESILALSRRSPVSDVEAEMQTALIYPLKHDKARDKTEKAMHAQVVLQDLYCSRLRKQLAGTEQVAEKGSGRLMGDGMPVLLTGDEFHARVVEKHEQNERASKKKTEQNKAKERYREEVARWDASNKERIKINRRRREEYKAEYERWEVERDLAKLEKRRARWAKPVKPTVFKGSPKPKLVLPSDSDEETDSDGDDCDDDEEM